MTKGQSSSYPLIMSYLTLRRIIGWIAVLLPLALVAARLFLRKQFNIPVQWPDSASGFYYSGMRDVFVGSVCALGVFLMAYRGYDWVDFGITFVAGFCAIGVALFPTKPTCPDNTACLTPNQDLVGNIHNGFAIALITLMGVMALRFAKSAYQDNKDDQALVKRGLRGLGFANDWSTYRIPGDAGELVENGKSKPPPSARLKRQRNWWYRASATVTLLCALLFLLQGVTPWLDWFKMHVRVFLLVIETVAIFSFGVAWFVKGRSLLPVYRMRALSKLSLAHDNPVKHWKNAQTRKLVQTRELAQTRELVGEKLAAGKSASQAAEDLGITSQRVSEIVAEIT